MATNGRPLARSPERIWAVEERVQSLRSLGAHRKVAALVRCAPRRRRSRVVQHRLDNQPSPPARGRRKRGAQTNLIGRSRGGPTTKVHLIVDALGLPVTFELTEGQRNDSVAAPPLVERVNPRCLLADKAYDTNPFRAVLDAVPCIAVIPPMGNRVHAFDYDKDLYKARSAVECAFNLLKQGRRFATRYEKTGRNYAAVVALGCALLWLRL